MIRRSCFIILGILSSTSTFGQTSALANLFYSDTAIHYLTDPHLLSSIRVDNCLYVQLSYNNRFGLPETAKPAIAISGQQGALSYCTQMDLQGYNVSRRTSLSLSSAIRIGNASSLGTATKLTQVNIPSLDLRARSYNVTVFGNGVLSDGVLLTALVQIDKQGERTQVRWLQGLGMNSDVTSWNLCMLLDQTQEISIECSIAHKWEKIQLAYSISYPTWNGHLLLFIDHKRLTYVFGYGHNSHLGNGHNAATSWRAL